MTLNLNKDAESKEPENNDTQHAGEDMPRIVEFVLPEADDDEDLGLVCIIS